jgi:hypothetical protein
LPKNNEALDRFLDELFSPYLDPSFIEGKVKEAEAEYPVILYAPKKNENFLVYLEGKNPDKYVAGRLPPGAGNQMKYIQHCLKEAIGNKSCENRLKDCHPNLLAVNFLLGVDYQLAESHRRYLNLPLPAVDFGGDLDGILIAACGIDKIPSNGEIAFPYKQDFEHPVKSLFNSR